MEKIDWNKIFAGSPYVKLTNDTAKELVLKDWVPQTKFKEEGSDSVKQGVEFTVVQEDGLVMENPKTWTVTSIKALSKLRPIVEKAEKEGKETIHVQVLRTGSGKDTVYSIKEL